MPFDFSNLGQDQSDYDYADYTTDILDYDQDKTGPPNDGIDPGFDQFFGQDDIDQHFGPEDMDQEQEQEPDFEIEDVQEATGQDIVPMIEATEVTSDNEVAVSPVNKNIDFSKATRNSAGKLCVLKEEMIQSVVKEPMLKCTHKEVEKCHYTYITKFTATQEQVRSIVTQTYGISNKILAWFILGRAFVKNLNFSFFQGLPRIVSKTLPNYICKKIHKGHCEEMLYTIEKNL